MYLAFPIIGAAAYTGWAIDDALRKTLFLAPARTGSTRLSIAPAFSDRALGARVSVGW
jgi:hypothetical protein